MAKVFLLAVYLTLLAMSQGLPAKDEATEDPELLVWLDGNGYRDVVVALRDDLEEKDCKTHLEGIQTMMQETSQALHQATRGKLYFAEVTVLLPATWTCADVPSESTTFTNHWGTAHLRIGPTHPVSGDNLWTQQPRGCGEEGDFIYLPEEWVNSYLEGGSSSIKELVAHWARYRWGVFEELGHQGDDLHPPTFLTQQNASTLSLKPNLCHNGDLMGSFSGECDNMEDTSDCIFNVNPEESTSVTSSLLSLPRLSSVLEFCDKSTHDSEAPTRHNLMCDGRSAWEVMAQHTDLDGRDEWQGNTGPTFNVVTAGRSSEPLHPNIVIVMEYTETMAGTLNRWKFLHDSVAKFLLVEAPQRMKVGLVSLTDSATTLAGLTTLRDSTSRQNLAALLPQDPPTINVMKNLEAGITEAATMLDGDGVVVLLVESLANHESEALNDLVTAAGETSVHIVLYPHLSSVDTSLYEELANATDGSLQLVVNPYGPDYQSVDDLVALNEHFRTILQTTMIDSTGWKNWKKEADGLCSSSCSLTLDLTNGSMYQSEIVLELSYLSFDAAGLTSVEMMAPDGATLTPSGTLEQDTLRHYFYTQKQEWQSGSYTVKVERETYVDEVVVSVLVRYRASTTPVVWASQPLLDLQQSATSPPTLFVQLLQGQNHVVGAMVTATITSSNKDFTFNLIDDGTRGDIMGGDGVYSGIIMGVSGAASVAIKGHDKEGAALLENNEAAGSFSVFTTVDIAVQGDVIADPPPSRVTDVRILLSQRSTSGVILQFTASGEDFYYGEAPYYEVTSQSLTSNEAVVQVVEAPPANAYSMVTLELQENENECDVVQVFSVRARDAGGSMSEVSNQPRQIIPCASTITTTPSSPPPTDGTDSTPTPTATHSSPPPTDGTDSTPTPTPTPSSPPPTDGTDSTPTPTATHSSPPPTDGTDSTPTPTATHSSPPPTDGTDSTPTPTPTPSSSPPTDGTDSTPTPTATHSSPPPTDGTDSTPTPTATHSSPPPTDGTDSTPTPTATHSSPPTDGTDSTPTPTATPSSPSPTDSTGTTTPHPPPPSVTTDTPSSPTPSSEVTTDTTTTSTEASTPPPDDNLGAILGGVFGGLACLVVVGVAGKFIYAKWAAKRASAALTQPE